MSPQSTEYIRPWPTQRLNSLTRFTFLSLYQMVPLHVAADEGRQKVVGFLFGKGVDIDMKDENRGVGL